jgi:hypothetical protein
MCLFRHQTVSSIRLAGFFFASLLGACGQPPAFTGVDPSETLPGTEVRLVGERFGDQLGVFLEGPNALPAAPATVGATPAPSQPATSISLLVTARSAATLTVAVPAETVPGTYDIVLRDPSWEVRVPAALVVRAPVVDAPCGHLYTANTTVSNVTGEVVVDRFYQDGQRETLRVKLADIERIEVERVPLEGGAVCSVVWMRKKDGERFRFADDASLDLASRGFKLGQEIGKPVENLSPVELAPPAP